jgi:hypothetical protein
MKELTNLSASNNKKLLTILPINSVNPTLLSELAYSLTTQDFPIDLLVLSTLSDEENKKITEALNSPKVIRIKTDREGKPNEEIKEGTTQLNFAIESTKSDTFQKAFNEGFNYAYSNDYQWFTVIEGDDFIPSNFYKCWDTYTDDEIMEFDGYMPLSREIASAGLVSFINEATWVEGLAEVAGTFDLNLLLRYNCMNITGAIFKTESVKRVCDLDGQFDKTHYFKPIKESMKINFSYEFFLRLIYNDLKFYTIPRVGYDRRTVATGQKVNYFSSKTPQDIIAKNEQDGGVTEDEFKFWNKLPTKEYFFEEDRNIQYKSA